MWISSTLLMLAATQSPVQEPPARTELKLIPEEGSCSAAYKAGVDEAGVLGIVFEDLTGEAKTGKYRVSCRLAGELLIPRGFTLDPGTALHAVISGDLNEGIDNITGRLKWGLGRGSGRDFQFAEYKQPEDGAEKKPQPVRLELKASVPEGIPLNCTEDVLWPVSLFVESTINGKAQSRIEQMSLDALNLVAGTCPEPQKPPQAQRK